MKTECNTTIVVRAGPSVEKERMSLFCGILFFVFISHVCSRCIKTVEMEIRKHVKTECSTVVIGESLVHSTSCV